MNEEPTIELQPELNQDKVASFVAELKAKQNLPMAVVGGLIAALVGAVLWALVTLLSGWQIGFMAIGVGFLVGWAVSKTGKGIDSIYGIVGGVLALFGCVLGNFLTFVGAVSKEFEISIMETLSNLDYSEISNVMVETFHPMDGLFYAIAVYQAYKMSFHQPSQDEITGLQG